MYVNKKLLEPHLIQLEDGSVVIPVSNSLEYPDATVSSTFGFVKLVQSVSVPDDNGVMKETVRGELGFHDDLATAMVMCGDYTVDEAVRVGAIACERCMNVLAKQYGLKWGYHEYTDEWKQVGTTCGFCDGMDEEAGRDLCPACDDEEGKGPEAPILPVTAEQLTSDFSWNATDEHHQSVTTHGSVEDTVLEPLYDPIFGMGDVMPDGNY